MAKAVCMGELLIDFTPYGKSEAGMSLYEMNPGGACANVACVLAKYGVDTQFAGKVGRDHFGEFLAGVLQREHVGTHCLTTDPRYDTTLAFVNLKEDGDRTFSFIRSPGADTGLQVEEIDEAMVDGCDALHFGAFSLTDTPSRDTILHFAKRAKEQGKIVSFDPNLREQVWDSLELAKVTMLSGLALCNVLKVSEEELLFLTGIEDIPAATEYLHNNYNIPVILATLGKRGVYCQTEHDAGYTPTYTDVKTIDTTGAGDCFVGSFLYQVLKTGLDNLKGDNYRYAIGFANAAASLSTTKKGAIPSIPDIQEVEALMSYKG